MTRDKTNMKDHCVASHEAKKIKRKALYPKKQDQQHNRTLGKTDPKTIAFSFHNMLRAAVSFARYRTVEKAVGSALKLIFVTVLFLPCETRAEHTSHSVCQDPKGHSSSLPGGS